MTYMERELTDITPIPLVCKPVYVPHGHVVITDDFSDRRQGPEGEDSTVASASAVTDEDMQGRDLWDEAFFGTNGNRSEELAADLFGILPEGASSMTCEEWSDGRMSRKQEVMAMGNRFLSVNSIPSCSDYTPDLATSTRQWEMRDAGRPGGSAFMDYVNYNTGAREAV